MVVVPPAFWPVTRLRLFRFRFRKIREAHRRREYEDNVASKAGTDVDVGLVGPPKLVVVRGRSRRVGHHVSSEDSARCTRWLGARESRRAVAFSRKDNTTRERVHSRSRCRSRSKFESSGRAQPKRPVQEGHTRRKRSRESDMTRGTRVPRS